MKTWILDSLQYIKVDRDGNVHFKNYHGDASNEITLTWRQFFNLHDIMRDMEYFRKFKCISIGDQVWFQRCNNEIQLCHSAHSPCFSFSLCNWTTYQDSVHRAIMSYIRREFATMLRKS